MTSQETRRDVTTAAEVSNNNSKASDNDVGADFLTLNSLISGVKVVVVEGQDQKMMRRMDEEHGPSKCRSQV
ncbi:hypothetical protein E2C01_046567 [Portunus trituberculatus]|uniref:Uncharacterized protein n=1 Tax=Portunus trituberculatus TaxID=210409 RepID=A0A5B7FYX7_PORTR|nr:hypothetical protein [Portunus trituberculatus]